MTTADGMQPVVVNVGACRCIGGAHTTDTVTLAPEASMTLGLRANGAIAAAGSDASRLESMLARVFIDEGITGWTFVDEDGDPEPITHESIERLLPWGRGGAEVSEAANDLYSEAVLGPLVRRSQNTRQHGPTDASTSAIRPSRAERRASSKSFSPVPSETRA
jgi:hypothetical protein